MTNVALSWRVKDLQGLVFGKLTVTRYFGASGAKCRAKWVCRCTCGKEVVRWGCELTRSARRGHVPSCPNCAVEKATAANTKHGMTKTPGYQAWLNLKNRCQNPGHPQWDYYGGRGITVCREWQVSFEAFWRDMGPTWVPGLEIDRRDNSRGYSPENCRWVTRDVNTANRRCTLPVDLKALSASLGIPYATLRYRWVRGLASTGGKPDPERISW